jgi:uncharacterized protein (TIGR03435 family)
MTFGSWPAFATMWMALGLGWAGPQSPTEQAPDAAFDVALIKPARPGARGYSIRPLHGRVSAENVTLKLLIGEAYHVHDFQVSGGPKWIDSDRYDVEAKVGGGMTPGKQQMKAMLQKLLAERFGLIVRHEYKEMPVFVLEAGKGRQKLQPTKHPEAPMTFRVAQRRQITAQNAPLESLTEALTWMLGRPVLDRTDLKGSFDYHLEWSPDELQLLSQDAPSQKDDNAPSLAGALQEQMGLKLVSQKGPVDLITVEKAERPTAN